jgi:hypothetical protein
MTRLLKCWTPWTHSYGWPRARYLRELAAELKGGTPHA